MTRLEFEIPTGAALCIATKASFFLHPQRVAALPHYQGMLKSAAWGGLRGLVARRKLLKAQGVPFFLKLQKNRALNGRSGIQLVRQAAWHGSFIWQFRAGFPALHQWKGI